MDFATRIKVLERLAQSRTPAAEEAIRRACEEAFTVLEGYAYSSLEFALEALSIVGFRQSEGTVVALTKFLRSIGNRKLQHSEELSGWGETLSKYRSAHTLMAKAINVLSGLRYLETPAVTEVLLWAAVRPEEPVRKSAEEGLRSLAKYNLLVFYGSEDRSRRGIGAAPQIAILDTIENKDDGFLMEHLVGILVLLEGLLSTSMESTRWSSNAVTVSRVSTPAAEEIANVRRRSICLLKRIYGLAVTKRQKLSIIKTLNAATHAENRFVADENHEHMIASNTKDVLTLFAQIAECEQDLQIVQKIEHNSYWIHYRSHSSDVKSAALAVKAIIDANAEYTVYKTLIGFEGIFGEWPGSRGDGSYTTATKELRVQESMGFASRIPDEGFEVWKQRIIKFAQTESNDMATFPVFYGFLEDVAGRYPDFALELLTDESEQLSAFLIPILRGLWDSEQQAELLPIMDRWIDESSSDAKSPLYACAKLFLSTKSIDLNLLRRILSKGIHIKDAYIVRQIGLIGIARSQDSSQSDQLKSLFLQALTELTELGDASWVDEVWYRKEVKSAVVELSPTELQVILKNLRFLPQISYQAEEVLAAIAEKQPGEVIDFLCARLYEPDERVGIETTNEGERFEELPYQFFSLHEPLAANAAMVVQRILSCYRKDVSLFQFRGAQLLQIIFPEFPESFQSELLQLISTQCETELTFVSGILRAYNGQSFIYPVARQLIKTLTPDSKLLNEVSIALQSTGVVTGEYGLSEAYEQKRLEALDWLEDPNERLRAFAVKYIADLESMRDSERRRAEESIALRKFEYGEE